jgi:hypothetical protein
MANKTKCKPVRVSGGHSFPKWTSNHLERLSDPKLRSAQLAAWRWDEPPSCFGWFGDPQLNTLVTRGPRGSVAGIALIKNSGSRSALLRAKPGARVGLLCMLLLTHSQQMVQRAHCHVNLAIPLALVPRRRAARGMGAVAHTWATFSRGPQNASIQDTRAGMTLTLLHHAQRRAQIVDQGLDAPCALSNVTFACKSSATEESCAAACATKHWLVRSGAKR